MRRTEPDYSVGAGRGPTLHIEHGMAYRICKHTTRSGAANRSPSLSLVDALITRAQATTLAMLLARVLPPTLRFRDDMVCSARIYRIPPLLSLLEFTDRRRMYICDLTFSIIDASVHLRSYFSDLMSDTHTFAAPLARPPRRPPRATPHTKDALARHRDSSHDAPATPRTNDALARRRDWFFGSTACTIACTLRPQSLPAHTERPHLTSRAPHAARHLISSHRTRSYLVRPARRTASHLISS